jgi:putative endonuclease
MDSIEICFMINFTNRTELGRWGEQEALRYLCSQGYRMIRQNYRCSFGEIDLIAQEAEIWCFIEVKTRRNHYFGFGYEALNGAKKEHLIQSAYNYLQEHQLIDVPFRFDLVSIDFDSKGDFQIKLIKNAFCL